MGSGEQAEPGSAALEVEVKPGILSHDWIHFGG
jgi:hypothetical protein